jgi:syntaxin-binding protein 1
VHIEQHKKTILVFSSVHDLWWRGEFFFSEGRNSQRMTSIGTIPSSLQLQGQQNQQRGRVSMREAVRNRILKEILGRAQGRKIKNQPTNGEEQQQQQDDDDISFVNMKKFALVLDTRSTRVLSSALLSHDLAEQGVAIVENLQKSRQPFPSLEAIYICEPTAENLAIIERDFHFWDSPLYFKAHVFLTRKPAGGQDKQACESLKERLRGAAAKHKKNAKPLPNNAKRPSRLATMLEANIDFLAIEENSFHLDLPKALVQLFGPTETQAVWCENRIVDGVASLCAALNEFPFVRYPAGNDLGASLAKEVNERVENLLNDDKQFWFHGSDQGGARATLLFLDRREDLAAPLLHEFTYQALVYDLLESRDNLIRYETSGDAKPKKALLNESDPLWVQFRHSHIAVVIERLTQITLELKNTTVGRWIDANDQGNATDLAEMTEVVREIPAFKEVMAKHTMHLAICQACMDKVTKRNLIETGKLEQVIVTGVDAEGEPVTQEMKLLQDLSAMMRRDEGSLEDKLRLACLHAVTLGQVHQETIQKFIRDNQLSSESQQTLLGLASLGVSLIASAGGGGTGKAWFLSSANRTKPPVVKDVQNNPYRNEEAIAKASKVAKSTTMKMSRFAPLIKSHVESICANRMTLESFPFAKPPPPNSGYGGSPIDLADLRGGTYSAHRVTAIDKSLSVRKHTAAPAAAGGASNNKVDVSAHSTVSVANERIIYQGGRIIVFIAGGMTYSEIRAINEVMKLTKREIIIGSTHIVRPVDFLRDLDILGDDEKASHYLDMTDDVMDNAKEFYHLDEEDEKLLGNVLIDKNIQMKPEEIVQEEEKKLRQQQIDFKKNQDLGIIPKLMSYIPFCGKNLAAWFNADDVDEFIVIGEGESEPEDDGVMGDMRKCFSCACLKPQKKSGPLADQGQAV